MTDKFNPHRQAQWQEEVDRFAAEASRIQDKKIVIRNTFKDHPVVTFIEAMQNIYSKPPVPRGFLRGGVHDR